MDEQILKELGFKKQEDSMITYYLVYNEKTLLTCRLNAYGCEMNYDTKESRIYKEIQTKDQAQAFIREAKKYTC